MQTGIQLKRVICDSLTRKTTMKNHLYQIRQEQPSDYQEVYHLVEQAFATTNSDGTEADYLTELRKKETFIPELSLVAENSEGFIIGQIVLYQTYIVTEDGLVLSLVLSPLSVHPDYFRRGIARALMTHAFHIACNMGYNAVFLCGDPPFYQRFGFIASYHLGIFHISDRKAEWCMVKELISDSLKQIHGTVDIV